jgi:HAE1 family hydrophobic/amphiphilic exporter-1
MRGAGPWTRLARIAVGIAALGTTTLAQVQQQPQPTPLAQESTAPPLAPRVGVPDAPLRITLADAIRMTLEHNNDVSIARLDTDIARQNVRAFEGVFDPRVTPNVGYTRNVTANTSAIGGATEGRLERTEIDGGAGMAGRTPWAGGRFTVDFSASRSDTSNQFARLNPEFPSALTASYLQPLLRNRSIDADRRNILLARRAVDLTDAQLTQVVMDQLTLVEEAYWDLVFAARNLEVLNSALGQARTQVESNERQVTQGTLAPIDVIEAQTQVSRFEQTVASGGQALTTAENRLKRLILSNRSAAAWNQPIVPADLTDRNAPPQGLAEAVKLALDRRPELKSIDVTLDQNQIDQRFFRNQAKPQLNVVGGYTLSGLAGDPLASTVEPPVGENANTALYNRLNQLSLIANLDPLTVPTTTATAGVPEFFVGGLGASLDNLFSRRFPTALVQLQMDFPLGNRTAKANLARAEIVQTQLERRRQQLEQLIESEVRDAMQAVRSSEQRLDAASSQRRYALEQYESERRRFDSGLSTVFLVLERQTAFVTAQALELRARADLNQAVAQLERSTGGTLEWHGVKIQ